MLTILSFRFEDVNENEKQEMLSALKELEVKIRVIVTSGTLYIVL